MPDIRAVLFDVDDTLVDTRGAFRHALASVAVDYLDSGVDHEELVRFWRDDRHGSYRAHTRGEMSHREQRHLRANDLHLEFGGPHLDDDAYQRWDDAFERYFREGWEPHPDAAVALDALDVVGVPYGALSNADHAYQELKLAQCGLSRVPMLVGVDTLGVGKPDPAVFLLACELLGTDPASTVYVGDEFETDGLGALNAGLQSVWLDRPGGRPRPISDSEVAEARRRGLVQVESLDGFSAMMRARYGT